MLTTKPKSVSQAYGLCKIFRLPSLLVILILWGCEKKNESNVILPEPFTIEIIGDRYHWQIHYPGVDGELHTADDLYLEENIHLPANIEIDIRLKSKDYIYFVTIPELQQMSMAVPGLDQGFVIKPHTSGEMRFDGIQMCGFTHETLNKKIVIESKDLFIKWFNKQN